MQQEIEVAKTIASRLVSSLQRPEWLQIAAGLKVGKAMHAAPKLYGQWVKEHFQAIAGQPAKDALWLLENWADVEPYTMPGEPLENVNHPSELRKRFAKLETGETPAAEGKPVTREQVKAEPPTKDGSLAFLQAQADKAGVTLEEFILLTEGLAVDLQQRSVKHVHGSAMGQRKTFDSPRAALAWLSYAGQWANAGGKSLQYRAAKLCSASGGQWAQVRQSAIVVMSDGKAGLDLTEAEQTASQHLQGRQALMSVKSGSVFTAQALPTPDGFLQAMLYVDDDHATRANTGTLTGILFYKSAGAVEFDSAAFDIESVRRHFTLLKVLSAKTEESRKLQLEIARDSFFGTRD